jgi:hypothetical protein
MIIIPTLGEVTATVSTRRFYIIIEIGDGSTEVCNLKVLKEWIFSEVAL